MKRRTRTAPGSNQYRSLGKAPEVLNTPVLRMEDQTDIDRVRFSLIEGDCPAELLYRVCNLPHVPDDVLRLVGGHQSSPPEVLRSLARHYVWSVRSSVANNLKCPVDVLSVLSMDSHSSVRKMVALHPCCPVHVVEELLKDRNWGVRMAAMSQIDMDDTYSPDELITLAKAGDATAKLLVMKHPRCSPEVLMSIWETCKNDIENVSVCRSLAGHRIAPFSLLREAAEHPVDHVRWAAAYNDASPEDVLEKLAYDDVLTIRAIAVSNPNCPAHILEQYISGPLSEEDECLYHLALNNPNGPTEAVVS